MISIVVPTYQEADNIPVLARAVDEALGGLDVDYELLFIDDDSQDGSAEICAELAQSLPVRIVIRRGERGLATAVLHGISVASGDLIVVMDADLSHPPSAIPRMIQMLSTGESDFVLGSRYVEGGTIDEHWSLFRKLNSLVPSLLARPLCPFKDPMSGFFALRRSNMPAANRLSPVGYKIGLEIFVRGGFKKPREVPIHFTERQRGESKLTLKEQVNFLRHLRRLYAYTLSRGKGS